MSVVFDDFIQVLVQLAVLQVLSLTAFQYNSHTTITMVYRHCIAILICKG